jgi:hypothetical protein
MLVRKQNPETHLCVLSRLGDVDEADQEESGEDIEEPVLAAAARWRALWITVPSRSMPVTLPEGPTISAARRVASPIPQPRSRTPHA